MLVLGIESSCDETSVALLDTATGTRLNKTATQFDVHAPFGGVVPELASRNHILKLDPLLKKLMKEYGAELPDIDVIGVTAAPGLIGALFVGVSYAKGLSWSLKRPLVAVNHLAAHVMAGELDHEDVKPPYLGLVISGGHTHTFAVDAARNFRLISKTVDDAAGESFDKVAKMMELGYPGGPLIEKLAGDGDAAAVPLPVGMPKSMDFSFSGVKTAVMNVIRKNEYAPADIAASFQDNVVSTIVSKVIRAAKSAEMKTVVVGGGVACNGYLRERFTLAAAAENIRVVFPSPLLCTDNGLMIAYAASKLYARRRFAPLSTTPRDADEHVRT